ncbi:xanthine dehydrogenase family protein subunit M [Rhodococcus sp. HNM0563]|uniref:FAD binding domain-containing protein n=1 Tax=unclassified Rhodococcus (in: high G+C Gram-positive bacteria) TaxID=192944 RepID=UPI00146B395F|nr:MULTISPECIES: xanthine dehydrogenase family protein subunit M [unclassified Rhodococcus (in: high G+C Gram-positive bacteria)]MCK0091605.1 xanthine dehydrogenase family protein subunit M [Rhodococcus sp. F64268]NLU63516.1 xanthine dehydrogenase family protein subunit M [Rhodococcus sp. HNM0563]
MIPAEFEYAAPTTLDEAVSALNEAGEDAKVLAGGQSLMPVLRLRMAAPTTIIDLGRVSDLRGIREDGDTLVIGATTTHYEVLHDPLVARHAQLLAEATATVADPQIRHRGTLGGALVHADPAGDLSAPALALDAEFVVVGASGTRTVTASDFFEDYFTTAVRPGEILAEIRIPKHTGWQARYEKFHRAAQQWSIVGVAATIDIDNGTIRQAKVALTNMAAVPVRARAVEEALVGQAATADTIASAAEHAADGTDPMTDGNADAEYRSHLATVLARRAVTTAAGL